MLSPFPRVEAIRMNFEYQFVKVRLEVSEFVKRQTIVLQI